MIEIACSVFFFLACSSSAAVTLENTRIIDEVYQKHRLVGLVVCLLVGCLTSQQHASVSQGRVCSDNFTCCHTEIEVVDQTFYLTQSQYTDAGPTSPSADPITPGAWQGSHWSGNVEVTGMTRPPKKSRPKRDSNPESSALEADTLPLGQRGGGLVVKRLASKAANLQSDSRFHRGSFCGLSHTSA